MAEKPHSATPKSLFLPHTAETGNPYYIGDIYHRLDPNFHIPGPENPQDTPYQASIAEVSRQWPYMQYLAEWMHTTCAPVKKKLLTLQDQQERASRIKVTLLEIQPSQETKRTEFATVAELRKLLEDNNRYCDPEIKRIFIVEDLSRDVIETLGHSLRIDPRFFREHISDYLWYNTRDPWTELPELEVLAKARDFFQLRYVQPRYFRDEQSFQRARREAGGFNVLRRVDGDTERSWRLDQPDMVIGLVRSKASLWTRPKQKSWGGVVGVLVVDPPITEGYPLWGGYNYFDTHEGMFLNESVVKPHWTLSMFDDLIYWMEIMEDGEKAEIDADPRIFALKILTMVASHWKVLLEYAKTRLTQIEWEIETPSFQFPIGLDGCLARLHRWRRVLPIYHSMVSDVIEKVLIRKSRHSHITSRVNDLQQDYEKILDQIVYLQKRAEVIVALVGTMISIEENKKATEQNANLTRLTYLASVFIPMSFLASAFSMQPNLGSLRQSFWIYFATAIPVTLVCIFVTVFLNSDRFIRFRMRLGIGRRPAEKSQVQ